MNMKLSRRCFLSFVIGGAAGTALSPLPWKLADDFGIWSTTWAWTPVPPDGETNYVDSTCNLCPGGCGISVRKINDRAIKVEGREGHPLNGGGVCMLGLSALQMLYSPSRIKQPLKRMGERGEGKWQPISWPEAVHEVVAKLKSIRKQGHPEQVAALMPSGDGTIGRMMQRLMTAYGSPNHMVMPSATDADRSALKLMQGIDGNVGADVANADFILSFGCALVDGYGSPVHMFQAVSRLKDTHGKLVQVEPWLSNTAAKADTWIPAKPGTEADVALAMAQVIISHGRYDRAFIEQNTTGLDAFTRLVNSRYTPDKVAANCGISEDQIVKTALAFAGARKPIALNGRGKGLTPGSLKEALAVQLLNALVGNFNKSGGMQILVALDYIQWPGLRLDDIAATGVKSIRADNAGKGLYAASDSLVHRFMKNVADGSATIEALMVGEANPCYSLPDSATVKETMGKIPYVVSFSSFMDETARQADLILPNHLFLERYEDVAVTAGVTEPVIGLCRPVVSPMYKTRHMGDCLIQIARGLGGSVSAALPWADYETCLHETLADQWRTLSEKGYLTDQRRNSAGRLVFMNRTIAAALESKSIDAPGDTGEYPLVLIPYDSIRLAGSYAADTPFMMKTVPDTVLAKMGGCVEMNPDTAAETGLHDGDTAILSTPNGKARVVVQTNHGLMPGVIAMPRGLGHTATNAFVAGKGTNINELIGSVEDPASGMDAAWGIRAQLAKA